MPVTCTQLYFDKNNELSEVYYKNLDKGHEVALNLYLKSMENNIFFQKTAIEDIEKESPKIFEKYRPLRDDTKSGFISFSKLGEVMSEDAGFDRDKIAMQIAKRIIARGKILSNELTQDDKLWSEVLGYGDKAKREILLEKDDTLPTISEEILDSDIWEEEAIQKDLKNIAADVAYKMDDQTSLGSYFHKLSELYFQLKKRLKETPLNELSDDEKKLFETAKDGEYKLNLSLLLKHFEKLLQTNKFREIEKLSDEDLKNFRAVIKPIEDYFTKNQLQNCRINTELSIISDDMKTGGTLDLILTNENDEDLIFDLKFKELGKDAAFFSTYGGNFNSGTFSHLPKNKQTIHGLQLNVAQYVLEKQYGRKVIAKKIFYFEGNINVNRNNRGIITGHTINNLRMGFGGKTIDAGDYQSEVQKFLIKKGVVKLAEKINEEGKINSLHEFTSRISGTENLFKFTNKTKVIEKFIENSVKQDKQSLRMYFMDRTLNKKVIFPLNASQELIREEVTKYVNKLEEDFETTPRNLMSFHAIPNIGNNKKWPSSDKDNNWAAQASALIGEFDDSTPTTENNWELKQVRSFLGFEDTKPNILLAYNKKTKESAIISIGSVRNSNLFDKKKGEDSNLFSKFGVSDKAFEKEYGIDLQDDGYYVSSIVNYQLLESSMIAAAMKKAGFITGNVKIKHGVLNGSRTSDEPVNTSLRVMSEVLNITGKVTKEDQNTELKNLFNYISRDKNFTSEQVLQNAIDLFDNATDWYLKNERDNVFELADLYKVDKKNKVKLLSKLIEVHNNVASTVRKTTGTAVDHKELMKKAEVKIIADAILHLQGIIIDEDSLEKKDYINNGMKLFTNDNNKIIQQVVELHQTNQQEIMRQFNAFKDKHKELVNKILKKKLGSLTKYTSRDLYEALLNMYIIDPTKMDDKTDYSNAYRLEDPENPTKTLSQEEKDYINFFNEHIEKGFNMILPSKDFEGVKNHTRWSKGLVPLQVASSGQRISRTKDLKKKFKLVTEAVATKGKKKATKVLKDVFVTLNNDYANQQNTSVMQHSAKRQEMLGINEQGQVINPDIDMLETNLEEILVSFYGEALKTSINNRTLGVINALHISLHAIESKNANFNKTGLLREYLDTYVKLVIQNEVNQEENRHIIDTASNIANISQMALSVSQPIQEALQGFFNTRSLLLNNAVDKMTGGEPDFTTKSWYAAEAYTTFKGLSKEKQLLSQYLVDLYGLYAGDMHFTNSNKNKATKEKFLPQTSNLYHANTIPGKEYRLKYFFSKFEEDKILDNAYEVDLNKKVIIYHPEKDQRFKGIFNEDMSLKDSKDLSLPLEIRENIEKYKVLHAELSQEDSGIDEKGIITRPYSNKDIIVIKNKVAKVYGSNESDNKVAWQASSIGGLFFRYKNWLPNKLDTYWTKTGPYNLRSKVVKVTNPEDPNDFYYERQAQLGEGICQTMYYIGKRGFREAMKEPARRENFRKLIADLIIWGLGYALYCILKKTDLFKTKEGKFLVKSFNNSLSDLMILQNTDYFAGGNVSATYMAYKRMLVNLYHVGEYSIEGEGYKALKSGMSLTSMTKQPFELLTDK